MSVKFKINILAALVNFSLFFVVGSSVAQERRSKYFITLKK